MSLTDWQAIVEQLHPFIQALRVTGGEPTLHRQFKSVIEMIDSLEVPFVLFTNGNWIDARATLEILTGCKHLQGVLVSLHGADAANYHAFTKSNAFDAVINNIRQAVKAGLRVATNSLLLTTTFQRVREITSLALSLGVSTVSFGRYYGPSLPGLSLSSTQMQTALIQLADLRREDPHVAFSNCVPVCFLPDLNLGERGCTSGFTHCTIGPQGDVRPCTHTSWRLGSIWQSDIETLWQSPQLDRWRRRIPGPCLSCAALSRCRGGCRATAHQLFLSQDPLMRQPLNTQNTEPITTIELRAHARPRLACSIQSTTYGYALHGAGHFVTLTPQSGPILHALDGRATLLQIEQRFGEAGLQLVGSLLRKRLVNLD